MRDPASSRDPLAHASRVRRIARSISALVALTLGLIVLGALVRAHGAGLACPDWPRCFGVWVPVLDLRIGFEWAHRVMAGSISLLFVGLGVAVLRDPVLRRAAGGPLAIAAALLVAQIVLGGLTVLLGLAPWTVTAHLLTGTSFAAAPKPGSSSRRRTKAPGAARPTRGFTSSALCASMTRIDRFG